MTERNAPNRPIAAWLMASAALVALLAPASLADSQKTSLDAPTALEAGSATASGLQAYVLDTTAPFLAARGVADHVLASSRVAGQTLQPVRLAPTQDPVALLQEAVSQALSLQAASLAGMTPDAWQAAHDGMAASLRMLEHDRDPATGAVEVIVHPEEQAAVDAGLEALALDAALQWQAAFILATAVDQALALLPASSMSTVTINTPLGDIIVDAGPAPCDDTYTTWLLLVIELCGNDTYTAPAGGADPLAGFPLSLIVDADGNDHVVPAPDTFPAVPSQAGALNGGLAITVDTFGDDDRRSGTEAPGAQLGAWGHTIGGAGVGGGFGLLVDQYGDDDNRVLGLGFPGKWGGGYFEGVGILVDGNGHDRYGGDEFEEGAGWFNGVGILADLADGDDRYYDYSTFAQGSGGYGGIGLLLDGIGNDDYQTESPYEQGAGLCGIGILADLTGSDSYRSASGAGQGFGGGCLSLGVVPPCDVEQDPLHCCDRLLGPLVIGVDCDPCPIKGLSLQECCDGLLPSTTISVDCDPCPVRGVSLQECCDRLLAPLVAGIDCRTCAVSSSLQACCDQLVPPTIHIDCGIGVIDPPVLGAQAPGSAGLDRLATDASPAAIPAVVGPANPRLAAPIGVGVLFDQNGNDRYQSGTFTQGAHLGFGIGALIDLQGTDTYEAVECAQGIGDFRPGSICGGPILPLLPVNVNCPAIGNPILNWVVQHACNLPGGLGIGLLAEGVGDDRYALAGKEGQGAGYSGGTGLLVDGQGHDSYTSPLNVNGPAIDAGGFQPRGDWGAAIDLI